MIVTKYIVTPEEGDWDEAHFELRQSDDQRPFHMVLRRSAGILAVNHMDGGEWGEEQILNEAGPQRAGTLVVEVVDDRIYLLAADGIHSVDLGVSQTDTTLTAAARNMNWRMESGASVPPMLRLSEAEEGGLPAGMKLGGRTLGLPDPCPRAQHAALVRAVVSDPGTYLHFVTSRPLVRPGLPLTVLDIDPSPFFALTAAVLFPAARILRLTRDTEQDAFVAALARANGLDGLAIVPGDEIAAQLADAEGRVLLQGAQAFDRFGAEIDALPDDARGRLSIWTAAGSIIPGNRVLPCANAQIQVPPHWALNHSAATAAPGRRPGLDIAVAAYDADAYLTDCVSSLLCTGREDIRVIIVDDGSTDGCGDRAAAQFADDPRVRVARKPNGGCASARNYGRLVSDATHVAFVDADDFVSENFFADLYDLALYSGAEVVQAGFDFYDEGRKIPFYPSYEDTDFADLPRHDFGGRPVIRLQSADILKGQPSIWRRVYRRDFLDARKIYFPENVRAYDDYIFQMFSLTAARSVLMLPEPKYHYRQHPAQDIRQGDERHFYMLYMFGQLLERSVDEGWQDFRPYAESVIDCISWSANLLRPDLVDSFLRASARFCLAVAKTHGAEVIEDLASRVEHPDFAHHFAAELGKAAAIPAGTFWARIRGELFHPDMLRMWHAQKKAQ